MGHSAHSYYTYYRTYTEELLVRAKKTQVVLHTIYDLCACTHVYVIRVYFAFTYDDLFQQYGCISSMELRNS